MSDVSPTAALNEAMTRLRTITVAIQRANGVTWSDIGLRQGITRQGACNRWGKEVSALLREAWGEHGYTTLLQWRNRCLRDIDHYARLHDDIRREMRKECEHDE